MSKKLKTNYYIFLKNIESLYLDCEVIMKSSGICRILMKICWNIEKDVPDLILGVQGADSGVKNQKNPKYKTQKNSKKSITNQRIYRNIRVGGMRRRPLNI